ncbi:hypothetical protein Tco_1306789 [Tanacetum coccineum]
MFLPLQEDQHSYDVHRDMRKVIVFQTWLSKFPIFLDQLLDLEALNSYSDTIDVEDQQMIFHQLTMMGMRLGKMQFRIQHQLRVMIAQKEEARIQLTQEEFNFMADASASEEIERVQMNCTSEDTL